MTISDEKRKAPDFILTNQDSILISNEDLNDKVYVLEFFFTRCPDICIEMNSNMKLLDEKFGDSDEFGIVSITIDPDNDNPSTLKEYSEALEIKSQNWHFLTGEKDYIYDLANNGFNIFAMKIQVLQEALNIRVILHLLTKMGILGPEKIALAIQLCTIWDN